MTKWVNKSTTTFSAMIAVWGMCLLLSAGIYLKIYRTYSVGVPSTFVMVLVEMLMLTVITHYYYSNKRYLKIIDKYDDLGYNNKVWGYVIALICFWGTVIWVTCVAGFWQ
jgi:hypothetical protein